MCPSGWWIELAVNGPCIALHGTTLVFSAGVASCETDSLHPEKAGISWGVQTDSPFVARDSNTVIIQYRSGSPCKTSNDTSELQVSRSTVIALICSEEVSVDALLLVLNGITGFELLFPQHIEQVDARICCMRLALGVDPGKQYIPCTYAVRLAKLPCYRCLLGDILSSGGKAVLYNLALWLLSWYYSSICYS